MTHTKKEESLNDALNRIALDIKPRPTYKPSLTLCRRASDNLPDFKQQFDAYMSDNSLTNEQYSLLLSTAVQISSGKYVSQKAIIKKMIDGLKNSSHQLDTVQSI